MAVSSTLTYCTISDVHDVFPDIQKYHNKTRIVGWRSSLANFAASDAKGSTLDLYYAAGTGYVDLLYWDGLELRQQLMPTTDKTTIDATFESSDVTISLDSATGFGEDDLVKIDNEYLVLGSAGVSDSFGVATAARGLLGTTAVKHQSGVGVKFVLDISGDLPHISGEESSAMFWYDDALDVCGLITDGRNPADYMIEAGSDYSTYQTRMRKKASRMVESQLDSRMAREIMKDREGYYPTYIIRAASLMTVLLILKANDPSNEYINMFENEYREIIKGYQDGSITLPSDVTKDSSKGVLREVSVNSSTNLYPVELRGHYSGRDYELLKLTSPTGGVIGTGTYSVFAKGSTTLKSETVVDAQIISGDFQSLGVGNLEVRFSGPTSTHATTTTNDEWEIELHGYAMDTTSPSKMGSVRMTRTGHR